MRHLLVAVFSLVGENAAAGLGDAEVFRNRADRAHETGELGLARSLGEFHIGEIGAFWNHQHMDRGLRRDVPEGERVVILVNFVAGDFGPQNFRKNIFVVWT